MQCASSAVASSAKPLRKDDKSVARESLRGACSRPVDLNFLRKAIAQGDSAGLDVRELAEATIAGLECIVRQKDPEACKLGARVVEERNAAVRAVMNDLERALVTRDITSLEDAIREGERVGLPAVNLEAARFALFQALAEERLRQGELLAARAELRSASASRNMERMRTAIAEAERVGVSVRELADAAITCLELMSAEEPVDPMRVGEARRLVADMFRPTITSSPSKTRQRQRRTFPGAGFASPRRNDCIFCFGDMPPEEDPFHVGSCDQIHKNAEISTPKAAQSLVAHMFEGSSSYPHPAAMSFKY